MADSREKTIARKADAAKSKVGEGDNCLGQRRVELARQNSWQQRVDAMLSVINSTLRGKGLGYSYV